MSRANWALLALSCGCSTEGIFKTSSLTCPVVGAVIWDIAWGCLPEPLHVAGVSSQHGAGFQEWTSQDALVEASWTCMTEPRMSHSSTSAIAIGLPRFKGRDCTPHFSMKGMAQSPCKKGMWDRRSCRDHQGNNAVPPSAFWPQFTSLSHTDSMVPSPKTTIGAATESPGGHQLTKI